MTESPNKSSTLVLQCNICPKAPTFSDRSHLLTHVSSKSHLSYYFKLQVRSHREPEAEKLLSEYDAWYKDNGLAALLAQRMRSRQKRVKQPTVAQGTASQFGPLNKTEPRESINPVGSFECIKNELYSFMDPELGDTDLSFTTDNSPYKYPNPLCSARNPLVAISENPLTRLPTALESLSVPFPTPPATLTRHDDFDLVADSMVHWRDSGTTSRQSHYSTQNDSFSLTMDSALIDENEEIKQAKLKGVFWPGMDIFDSATEQMRKKRNQRKDDSVLLQMKKTSDVVEPTEQVYSPGGTLQKERTISGNVEDWTPVKGESPFSQRKRGSGRPGRGRGRKSASGYADDGDNLEPENQRKSRSSKKKRTALADISQQSLSCVNGLSAYQDDDFDTEQDTEIKENIQPSMLHRTLDDYPPSKYPQPLSPPSSFRHYDEHDPFGYNYQQSLAFTLSGLQRESPAEEKMRQREKLKLPDLEFGDYDRDYFSTVFQDL